MLIGLSSEFRKALIMIGAANLILAIAIVLIVLTSIFFLCMVLQQFFHFRRPREVRCPETNELVVIRLNVLRACFTVLRDRLVLQVVACSLLPVLSSFIRC